jgi:putative transposase
MQRLTVTHSARWKQHKKEVGVGHLYQGRYKSFPIESDNHFIQVVRYVERNALRANLVREAENWEWSSLWIQQFGSAEHRRLLSP